MVLQYLSKTQYVSFMGMFRFFLQFQNSLPLLEVQLTQTKLVLTFKAEV